MKLTEEQREKLERYNALLLELKKREEERNAIYKLVRRFPGRHVILIGGSNSGKSYEIADFIVDRLVREKKEQFGKNHRILCIRNEAKQVTISQFPLLRERAKRYNLEWNVNKGKGNESISVGNNEFLFAGLDDVDKLKSIFDITSYWVEEADQICKTDFEELERRLRGYKGIMQAYFTFNPTSRNIWLKPVFFDKLENKEYKARCIRLCGEIPFEDFLYYKNFNVTDEELHKKISVWDSETESYREEYFYNTLIIHSTYRDNKFITDEDKKQMADMKERSPEDYEIYGLGGWGTPGGNYFDKHNVMLRIRANIKPIESGEFEFDYVFHEIKNIKWRSASTGKSYYLHELDKLKKDIKTVSDEGYIRIYEFPKPTMPYVIGADTAGDGSDWNAAVCTNNVTNEDTAVIHINFDEDIFARQLYCLGLFYGRISKCANDALIGIETNFSTHPQKELMRWNYSNLYIRETAKDTYTYKSVEKYGFNTNAATRPHALDMLRTIVRDEPEKIKDRKLLDEMTTFVKNEKGRPEAMQNEHDDLIMSRAINCYISPQQINYCRIFEESTQHNFSKVPDDYLEDYYGAPESQKQYILERWIKEGVFK